MISTLYDYTVADLEGVRVVHLKPPLGPNYFNFMGKFTKKSGKMLKTNPLLIDLNPPSRSPGYAPAKMFAFGHSGMRQTLSEYCLVTVLVSIGISKASTLLCYILRLSPSSYRGAW